MSPEFWEEEIISHGIYAGPITTADFINTDRTTRKCPIENCQKNPQLQ